MQRQARPAVLEAVGSRARAADRERPVAGQPPTAAAGIPKNWNASAPSLSATRSARRRCRASRDRRPATSHRPTRNRDSRRQGSSARRTGAPSSTDVEKSKPGPDLIRAALQKVPEAEHPVMVGDSTWDCQTARRAGITSVALLTGGFPADSGVPPGYESDLDGFSAGARDLRQGHDDTGRRRQLPGLGLGRLLECPRLRWAPHGRWQYDVTGQGGAGRQPGSAVVSGMGSVVGLWRAHHHRHQPPPSRPTCEDGWSIGFSAGLPQ